MRVSPGTFAKNCERGTLFLAVVDLGECKPETANGPHCYRGNEANLRGAEPRDGEKQIPDDIVLLPGSSSTCSYDIPGLFGFMSQQILNSHPHHVFKICLASLS